MNKIQDFLKRKGIEDKIVDYDETNEPLTPSYIIEEWEKEQLRIGGVVKSLPSKHDMWEERGKQVVKLEESDTSFSKHTPHLLGFTLGFEKCYEWLTK